MDVFTAQKILRLVENPNGAAQATLNGLALGAGAASARDDAATVNRRLLWLANATIKQGA